MTLVKICGITNLEDAIVALDAGADLLGFVFYPKSPRYVSVETASTIMMEIKGAQVANTQTLSHPKRSAHPKFVALFVNESTTRIQQILVQTGLDYAQLHGDETPDLLASLGNRAFRAIRPTSEADAQEQAVIFYNAREPDHVTDKSSADFLRTAHSPRLLIDAYDPAAFGGTGKKADWHAAANITSRYANVLLAGGLTPENVGEAISLVQPWGVDVSSGVEASPGRKDAGKVRAFIQAAKDRIKE